MTNNLTGRMAAAMRNAVLLSLTLLLTSSNSFLRSARILQPSHQSYVCTCLQTEGTKTLESSRVLRIHDTSLTSFRGNKFVSPVMEDRLKRGLLTSADLDRWIKGILAKQEWIWGSYVIFRLEWVDEYCCFHIARLKHWLLPSICQDVFVVRKRNGDHR